MVLFVSCPRTICVPCVQPVSHAAEHCILPLALKICMLMAVLYETNLTPSPHPVKLFLSNMGVTSGPEKHDALFTSQANN